MSLPASRNSTHKARNMTSRGYLTENVEQLHGVIACHGSAGRWAVQPIFSTRPGAANVAAQATTLGKRSPAQQMMIALRRLWELIICTPPAVSLEAR